MKYYSKDTEKVLELSKKFRKKIGLFPTDKKKVDFVLSLLDIKKGDYVLEPSFGTGDFLIPLKNLTNNVYGVEKETSIYKDFGNTFNTDFLTWETDKRFDFIVGNPPFFETKEYKELFEEVSFGRNNIYSFFIKKSIDLLKDNGVLAFIIPKSLNTGKYFYKIREYIVANTNIIGLYDLDSFEGVSQNTQVLILKKEKNKKDYVVEKKESIIFSKEKTNLEKLLLENMSIKDLGFSVKTGSFVWNENRNLLSNNKSDTLLVWGGNISNFEFKGLEDKYQYALKKPEYEKGIVSNRIFGGKLNFALINTPFIAENHVNVIVNEKNKITYEELFELLKKVNINEYCHLFTGNTQISKKELEEMPIWGATKETGPIK